jgi:hypothetical protein
MNSPDSSIPPLGWPCLVKCSVATIPLIDDDAPSASATLTVPPEASVKDSNLWTG